MEQVSGSRFSKSFVGKVVTSGSKVSGSAFPTLTATSTKDKFVLNSKALALLGIGEGDNVVMIDLNKGEVVETDSNKRWYLTKGYEKGNGNMEGAKIGKNGSFSYAGIYSAIQMNKPEISEASVKDMVDAGLGITRGDKDSFIATQKVHFRVQRLAAPAEAEGEPDITEFEVAKGIFQPVYALTDRYIVSHDPKKLAEGSEEEEENENEQ